MSNIPKPQETGTTTIEMPTEGHTNGTLGHLIRLGFDIEHDDEREVYVVSYDE